MKRLKLEGKKLKTLRAEIWQRALGCCDYCGRWVAEPDFHLHHRQLRSAGGADIPANCIVTCPPCHEQIHHHVAKSIEDGFLVSRYADPAERQMCQHHRKWVTL